ncbi:EPIDERMAL PATTERNING FACTOR-like protein 6 [Zea mays]|uniref:EPIDERMAL PATTERNING FACTOR-like protein 6 n=1 Tax=Zea mays TaxID=4577 RepID=A0A1D6FSC3_MAIZE|nr:EPIDERMAL PATTERNING FACTOR-like protein 6 [Zea mays]
MMDMDLAVAGAVLHRTTTTPAARGRRLGVAPATVRLQMRTLRPLLPGVRAPARAAGGSGLGHPGVGVLPGGVAVQVPGPALHAVTEAGRRSIQVGVEIVGRDQLHMR